MKLLLGAGTVVLLLNLAHSYSIPSVIRPPEGCNHTALRQWLNQACYHPDNMLVRGKRSAVDAGIDRRDSTQAPTDDSLPGLFDYLLPQHKNGHHSHHHRHHHARNENNEVRDRIVELLLQKMKTENGRQKRRLFNGESIYTDLKDKCCRDECFIEDLRANC